MRTTYTEYILGINEGSCASAAISRNGKIIAAASEERFTRIKNQWGYPKQAIQFCLEFCRISSEELSSVVLSNLDPYPHFVTGAAVEKSSGTPQLLRTIRNVAPTLEYYLPVTRLVFEFGRAMYYKNIQPLYQRKQVREIAQELSVAAEKIMRVHHHTAHAYAAYYSSSHPEPTLVITCDGAGDDACMNIFIVKNGNFKLISKTHYDNSIGLLYAAVTSYLGLKAHEDEHKVMGLAAYSNSPDSRIVKVFADLISVEGLQLKSVIPARLFGFYVKERLSGYRFDAVATAIQAFLDQSLSKLIQNAITQTGITSIACSGGVFLNVKTNQYILNNTKLTKVFFMPSAGDESNALGACYYGTVARQSYTPSTLNDLYLGPQITTSLQELKKLVHESGTKNKITIKKLQNSNKKVAQLLARGEIVARVSGRMEFGARALGNRSILASPKNSQIIHILNKSIKSRDFWMPFAPSILESHAKKLLQGKKYPAYYMNIAYNTNLLSVSQLAAAMHPFDETVRPQIVTKVHNKQYFDLIEAFYKITGIAALLNTSCNIHGEPIVCNDRDAIKTFTHSGLRYMMIEQFLLIKKV